MGSISIVQGGALRDRYRALVLGHRLGGPLQVRAVTPGGLAAEEVVLTQPGGAKLKRALRDRRTSAYQLSAWGLRSDRWYRFELEDGAGNGTYLDTYTLPEALPSSGMTVAVGSCFYDGFHMADRLAATLTKPILGARAYLQLWGGDNLYADVPAFGLFSGSAPYEQTVERYLRYFRATPYMRGRALTPAYTTYDDHEFWNNFPESQPHLSRSWGRNAAGYATAGRECLDLFQSNLNPRAVAARGRSFRFDLSPLSFFFADVRSERTLHDGGRGRMMTAGDVAALGNWARNLRGPGVLVIGQPLWIKAGDWKDYTPPSFVPEYRAIWKALKTAPYDVLVVSGDVHHSRALKITMAGAPGRMVYEFVSSPASHIPTPVTTVIGRETQDRGKVSPPGSVPNSGVSPKASYYFGTSAPNTLGLLRFVPKAGGAVDVGAAFVDYTKYAWGGVAPSERVRALPHADHPRSQCFDWNLFTLKKRPPLP